MILPDKIRIKYDLTRILTIYILILFINKVILFLINMKKNVIFSDNFFD